MAKKSPRRRAKRTVVAQGKIFSLILLHQRLDWTLKKLKKERKTKKRDELIGLVQKLRDDTPCGKIMLCDLGV